MGTSNPCQLVAVPPTVLNPVCRNDLWDHRNQPAGREMVSGMGPVVGFSVLWFLTANVVETHRQWDPRHILVQLG